MNNTRTSSARRIVNLPRPKNTFKENQVVLSKIAPSSSSSVRVAANPNLSVVYPIIKTTRSGKQFVEHIEVPRHSIHPNCHCHTRTYLRPHNDYFTCDDCHETHYVHCDESPYIDIKEVIPDIEPTRCGYCFFQRYNKVTQPSIQNQEQN